MNLFRKSTCRRSKIASKLRSLRLLASQTRQMYSSIVLTNRNTFILLATITNWSTIYPGWSQSTSILPKSPLKKTLWWRSLTIKLNSATKRYASSLKCSKTRPFFNLPRSLAIGQMMTCLYTHSFLSLKRFINFGCIATTKSSSSFSLPTWQSTFFTFIYNEKYSKDLNSRCFHGSEL